MDGIVTYIFGWVLWLTVGKYTALSLIRNEYMNQQQNTMPRQEASGGITPTKRPPLAPTDAVVLTELRWVVFETCSSTMTSSYPVLSVCDIVDGSTKSG